MTAALAQRNFAGLAFNFTRVGLVGLFILMLVAALHPDVRSSVRTTLASDYRTVLSTATGDLLGDSSKITVVKVKSQDSMMIEIYQTHADGSQKLLERISMPDKKDGFFNFNGQATNLAIDDIDGDGRQEILAPSFDQNLVGHLNIYGYNSASNSFELRMN